VNGKETDVRTAYCSVQRVCGRILPGVLVAVLLFSIMLIAGCGSSSTDSGSTDQTTAGSGEPTKTLTIGAIDNFQATVGVDQKKCLAVAQDMINAQGGITVAGEKYNLKIIIYDDGGDSNNGKTAVNRLIFEDKAKFIIGDFYSADVLLPLAEENKVILSAAALSPAIFNPEYKYCFNTAALTSVSITAIGWVANKYPAATAIFAAPDDQGGNVVGAQTQASMAAFGLKGTVNYYPASSNDFSSVATKVKQENPQLFASVAESVILKNVYESGWRGTFFGISQVTAETILSQVPEDELTGYVGPSAYTEYEEPMTQLAADFKAAYVEEYGEWNSPSVAGLSQLYAILAAIQKADSIDVDKVAEALASGLSYESPGAKYQMVARPDYGITRTVDSVIAFPMKKIVNGKAELVEDISIETAVGYAEKVTAQSSGASGPPAGAAPTTAAP
jgi:branched-chain amino acid transport system substrate-binding protein